jgi:hypothetical protein
VVYDGGCPDCGRRQIELPEPLPTVGDDFDWQVRDYDGFRRFMLEELAARFPRRAAFTTADLEVVLVEAFATVLDRLSDLLDRVTAEATLGTAQRPDSVRKLLALIGYDAVARAVIAGEVPPGPEAAGALDRRWAERPEEMEEARAAGPHAIQETRRLVSLDDYGRRLEDHPLVLRAQAAAPWRGSWTVVEILVIARRNLTLDADASAAVPEQEVRARIDALHATVGSPPPSWDEHPTIREVLGAYLEPQRLLGQEVTLLDSVPVGIALALSIRVAPNYFRSEVGAAAERALGSGEGGFFAPGRRRFGEDLFVSDLFQVLLALEGVEDVCVSRFKRVGSQHPDQTGSGHIVLSALEIAVCDNLPGAPERGSLRLTLNGGLVG